MGGLESKIVNTLELTPNQRVGRQIICMYPVPRATMESHECDARALGSEIGVTANIVILRVIEFASFM